jgi:hypothetical protein
MSNKQWGSLQWVDKALHCLFPTQMWENGETIVNIRMFGGFEIFNTRPYHNYEDWAEGYEITSPLYPKVKVTAEDLDDAIKLFAKAIKHEEAIKKL